MIRPHLTFGSFEAQQLGAIVAGHERSDPYSLEARIWNPLLSPWARHRRGRRPGAIWGCTRDADGVEFMPGDAWLLV